MNKQDASLLHQLSIGREYEAMRRLADDMIANWTNQVSTGETEFQYLKNALERDGKIMGLRALLNEIERISNI